jgi:uncharacterized coiled-coil DUF342 family protein
MGGVQEFFSSLPPWLGTLPNWITASGMVTIVGLVFKYRLGLGSLKVEERKIESADDADIRDHYAAEVKRLREALQIMEKHYREMLADSDRRHEECQKERDEMHAEIRCLYEDVDGLKRQIAHYSADQLITLQSSGKPIPSHAVEAARRVIEQHDKDNGGSE